MAVIKEWKNEHGATIRIDDAAYRDKSVEEIRKLREHANATAYRLLKQHAERGGVINGNGYISGRV